MKTITVTLLLIITMFSCIDKNSKNPDYLDANLSFEDRALDLISRMTTEEKLSQMIHDAPAIDRLNIPYYNWMNEWLQQYRMKHVPCITMITGIRKAVM